MKLKVNLVVWLTDWTDSQRDAAADYVEKLRAASATTTGLAGSRSLINALVDSIASARKPFNRKTFTRVRYLPE